MGGPLALVEDGDEVIIDLPARRLDLNVPEAALAERRGAWSPPKPKVSGGFIDLYAALAGPTQTGARLEPPPCEE